MRTITKEYTVYKYEELSEKAKERAKQDYLDDDVRPLIFTENCNEALANLFGCKAKLAVQYSLCYCQGDGLNIYGHVSAEDIFNCLEKDNGSTQLAEFKNQLSEREKKTILFYASVCGDIELPYNRRYCYSLADQIDIAENWTWELENNFIRSINSETLQKFEKLVREIFLKLCEDYEKDGYSYFYEVDDEEMEEISESNGWEFLEDGRIA